MLKWLFFDLGSTLIDESECIEYRICELLKQENAPPREVLERRMRENAALNRLPYKDTVREFGLQTSKWPKQLEKLYSGVPEVLLNLRERYSLGVIANQSAGTEERLTRYGIRECFEVIVASAEEGLEKPDPEIFRLALRRAGCTPDESCMIGDRLDNDIVPANRLGMKTVWVRQGFWGLSTVRCAEEIPTLTIDMLNELCKRLHEIL